MPRVNTARRLIIRDSDEEENPSPEVSLEWNWQKSDNTPTILEFSESCVTQTNLYAEQMGNGRRRKLDDGWFPVTKDEELAYYALCILITQVKKPNIQMHWSKRKVIDTPIFRKIPKALRHKLDQKAVRRILVGFQENSENYKLFDPESRRFHHAANVKFLDEVGDFEFATIVMGENISYNRKTSRKEANKSRDEDEEYSDTLEGPSEPKETEMIQRESMKLRPRHELKQPKRYACAMLAIEEPRTCEGAMSNPQSTLWKKAMKEEIEAHVNNST
ncbi:hypothetical protein KM043_015928 [Ampulex compressa]|nr:hypothetical protein KM043_015928 [Ampulex compressa]